MEQYILFVAYYLSGYHTKKAFCMPYVSHLAYLSYPPAGKAG